MKKYIFSFDSFLEIMTEELLNKEIGNVSAPGAKKEKSFYLFAGLGALVLILLATAGVGVYRAYAKVATDNFTIAVAKILRLPAVKVGTSAVSYTDFVDDLKAIHKMQQYDSNQLASGASPSAAAGANLTEEQMIEQVLWRLVNIVLVDHAAKEYDIFVEQSDVDELKAQMMKNFKDETAASEELNKRYGWSLAEYENKIMRPFVIQQKLSEKLKTDENFRTNIQNRAAKVLEEIKGGAVFADMAKAFGEDGTASRGGDLGWFGKGNMVPQFEQAVYSLRKGELYPTLVESPYGYHIIKLDDRKTEKVKDENGKTINAEKVRASHILFMFPTLEKYLNDKVTKAKIDLFINVHNPFQQIQADAAAAATTTK